MSGSLTTVVAPSLVPVMIILSAPVILAAFIATFILLVLAEKSNSKTKPKRG